MKVMFTEVGRVDDEALAEARHWIGKSIRLEQWNTEAARDTIRHYAFGIGDANPLWVDEAYGRRSIYGTNLAPPTFLYSIYDAEVCPGLGGLLGMHVGARWTFHERVRLGDQIRAEATVKDASIVAGSRGARRIMQVGLSEYFRVNDPGENVLVGAVEQIVLRMPRKGEGDDGLQFEPRTSKPLSERELNTFGEEVLAAPMRGSVTRYYDDTRVGEDIGYVLKGPYSSMAMICYYAGAIGSSGYKTFEPWWRNRWFALHDPDKLPENFDPAYYAGTGITSSGHHDASVAREMGMPGAYDNGNQRVGIVANLLTNWMGDAGFLRYLDVRNLLPVITGDFVRVTGQVRDIEGRGPGPRLSSYGAVSVSFKAVNQIGEVVTTGSAIVELPKK